MLYSIIDTKKGEAYGIVPRLHILCDKGTKMIVNENELRKINANIEYAAEILGGTLMTEGEIINEQKKLKQKDYE